MKPINIDDIELVRRGSNVRARRRRRRVTLARFFQTTGFSDSIIDVEMERTIEGASTLTVTVSDPDGQIANMEEFCDYSTSIYPTELRVLKHWFALAGLSRSDDGVLSLTFEDREVNVLRRYTSPRKAKRARLTRAEFCRSLVNEARIVSDRSGTSGRIQFVSPEVHMRQVIGRDDQTVAQAISSGSGFPAGIRLKYLRRTFRRLQSGIKWKNEVRVCTKTQLNYYDDMFRECLRQRAPKPVYRAAALLALSGSNLWNTNDMNLYGLPRRSPWIVSAGTDSQLTLRKLTPVVVAKLIEKSKQRPTWDGLLLASSISGRSVGSMRPWWKYAQMAYREWAGGLNRNRDAYEFSRGVPNGEFGESTWEALNRMASEVGWRCWCDAGTVFFVSEDYMLGRPSSARIFSPKNGVNGISWSQEGGMIAAECSVSLLSDVMDVDPGSCVTVTGEGAADGKWIVASVTQSVFSVEASVTLKRAQPRLAEPRGEIGALAVKPLSRRESNVARDDEIPDQIVAMLKWCDKIDKRNYTYAMGGGNRSTGEATNGHYDCSGLVIGALHAGNFNHAGMYSTVQLNNYGESGRGKYFTLYSRGGSGASGHTFIIFEKASGREGKVFEAHGPSGARVGWQRNTPGDLSSYRKRHPRGM